MKLTRAPAMPPIGTGGSDIGCGIGFHGDVALGQHRVAPQPAGGGRSGVNRLSSSRPVGTGKSAGS
jgi:hypothetical protein